MKFKKKIQSHYLTFSEITQLHHNWIITEWFIDNLKYTLMKYKCSNNVHSETSKFKRTASMFTH